MTTGHTPLSCQRKLSISASLAHSGCVWSALILLSGVIYEGCIADLLAPAGVRIKEMGERGRWRKDQATQDLALMGRRESEEGEANS